MIHQGPFGVQELVDHCIGFLVGSTKEKQRTSADLRSCALVARSWVQTSQRHLFATIIFPIKPITDITPPPDYYRETANIRTSQLLEAWDASPHLARYTKSLAISLEKVDFEKLLRVCHVPFTHLSYLSLSGYSAISSDTSSAVRQLLRLPSLISVTQVCRFQDRDALLDMWEHCSPSIEHITLFCFSPEETHTGREPADNSRLRLKSLNILSSANNDWWWQDGVYSPFDLSALKSLACYWDPSSAQVLRSPSFASALRSIEVLTFAALVVRPWYFSPSLTSSLVPHSPRTHPI